jgi:putative alpha-1,2-mannosidase
VRKVLNTIWTNTPKGMPGNDDLGEMSSWYVWSAIGMYPQIPGRAELVLGSPLFRTIHIRRPAGDIIIHASGSDTNAPYIQSLKLNGKPTTKTWLPESFVEHGGTLDFTLTTRPVVRALREQVHLLIPNRRLRTCRQVHGVSTTTDEKPTYRE